MAGLSALAYYTKLTEPTLPVHAVSGAQFKALELKGLTEIPEPVPGGGQLQVWIYAPILAAGTKTHDKKAVDPLSLSLGFQEISDERIELALEELREHFPW